MTRVVSPEILDVLPADDPLAIGSRRDLQRLNRRMHSAAILSSALLDLRLGHSKARVLEVGAGDGTLLLDVAQRLGPAWRGSSLQLLDRQNLLEDRTAVEFEQLGWHVSVVQGDLEAWLEVPSPGRYDVVLCNLFLHHFHDDALARLLPSMAARSATFIALEPRRWLVFWLVTRMLWLLGCNKVTRHDAQVSVRAGFKGGELQRFWPMSGWSIHEKPAGIFSHLFVAKRLNSERI